MIADSAVLPCCNTSGCIGNNGIGIHVDEVQSRVFPPQPPDPALRRLLRLFRGLAVPAGPEISSLTFFRIAAGGRGNTVPASSSKTCDNIQPPSLLQDSKWALLCTTIQHHTPVQQARRGWFQMSCPCHAIAGRDIFQEEDSVGVSFSDSGSPQEESSSCYRLQIPAVFPATSEACAMGKPALDEVDIGQVFLG